MPSFRFRLPHLRFTRGWRHLAVAISAVLITAGLAAPAQAVPVQGHTPWSVLLCKFRGLSTEQRPASWFADFLINRGTGGVADYLADQSRGRLDLRGSAVRGWYTMSRSLAESGSISRWQRIQDCVAAAAAGGYTVPSGHRVVAIINGQVDSGAAGGRVLLDPGAWNVGFAAHEMLHGYALGHSFSDDTTYRNASWSAPGEYDDPWDQMSAMNIFAFATARFGTSAVGLNGYFRDKLGWLDARRTVVVGADGVTDRTVRLTALEDGAAAGPQVLRIPFDPGDLQKAYTVEFRRKTGWSAGIPTNQVLIHEIKNGTPYLLRTPGTRTPVQSLDRNGIRVRVLSTGTTDALVSVSTPMPTRCLTGYVWREARAGDQVCVTPATRTQVRADNAVATSRWVVGPYGPHTCVQGYVWREAFPGDDVCVTGSQRTQAAVDNAAAPTRRNPARFAYGPNACKPGYVWREADASDVVCVPGSTRTQTRADNAAAAARWVVGPYGPHTCRPGYVWREAFVGDDVCVYGWIRTQAAADNVAAGSRTLVQ
ncbi:MAG: hypothetical protein IPI32_16030 [Austwickia sp.]|jgi:hypothetical protein|nr:hypothetical protein [Austwickia sp.]MBK8435689.1 hypothetical protein [Austwickia sp.]MBK9100742.1 hypothetical protein [Austwickia sp.]